MRESRWVTEMKDFVTTNRQLGWSVPKRESGYGFLELVLKAQQYRRLSKGPKGIVKS